MKNDTIKYGDLSLIGMELFRKNNDTFMRSKLSPIMTRIFKVANRNSKIDNTDNEYYMKSGILPNRVFYIYSDNLKGKDAEKLLDVVEFNGELCIWFYTNNAINMIEKSPVYQIYSIYSQLFSNFITINRSSYIDTEITFATYAMTIRMIKFLGETYGVLDIDECLTELKNDFIEIFTEESCNEFFRDIVEKCDYDNYFNNREFLDSCLLLEEANV